MFPRSVRTSIAAARRLSSATAEPAAEKASTRGVAAKNEAVAGGSSGRDTLGKRLLRLVYPKRSAVVAIRMWKDEGRTVRKFELSQVVKELRKLRRYKHALEICEWMTQQKDIKLQAGDYAVHLDLVAKVYGINRAEKFFEDLPGPMADHFTYSALLNSYVQNNLSEKAEALMAKMLEHGLVRNSHPYNHMISLHLANGQLEKVHEVIQELMKHTTPDILTYNLWISVCAKQNDVETAEKVFCKLKVAKLDPDWVTYSSLTNLYMKRGLHEKAASSLKDMEKIVSRKNRVAYSSLLSLHTNMGNKDALRQVWKKIKSTFRKMNDTEYHCMISSLLKLDELKEAEDLYTEWETVSGTNDSRVPNLLLAAYINRDQMETAETFCKQVFQKDMAASYTTFELLTWGYLKQKRVDRVLVNFKQAVNSVAKWDPDEKFVRGVFELIEEKGSVEGAEELLDFLRKVGHVTTEIYNSLLRTYAKAEKMPLLVEERMAKDKVKLDEETRELLKITSKLCVTEVSSSFLIP